MLWFISSPLLLLTVAPSFPRKITRFFLNLLSVIDRRVIRTQNKNAERILRWTWHTLLTSSAIYWARRAALVHFVTPTTVSSTTIRYRTLFPYKPGPVPSFLVILKGQESKIWTFFEGLRSRKEKMIKTPSFFGKKIN